MSGGGGGDYDVGPGPGGPGAPGSCDTLRFRTSLVSPDPAVVASLNVGDRLTLAQEAADQPVLALHGSDVAGSVAGVQLATLLRCITEGFLYEAEVVQISGGSVEVEVKLAGA